jgi:biopolymer transport protein ExbD
MRYFLFFLILTVTGCSGQQTSDQQTTIDTAKLFNPNGHPDNSGANDMNMFKRAVGVVQQGYAIKLNDKETDVETLNEVESFIVSNKEAVKKDLFYILMDSTTDFKRTLSVINILTKNQITNYKVINIQKYFTPAEPVTIQTPSTVISTHIENDSSYFAITILNNGIDVKLFGQETKLKNTIELDNFIANHKADISTKKISIISSSNLKYDKFKPVIEILKKHEYYKYNLVTNSSQ